MPFYVRTVLITCSPDEAVEAVERHLEQLRELHRQGRLRAAGEFPDGDGFLEIFEAEDRMDADAIARSSPLVEEGLGSWLVRRWNELDLD